MNLNAAIDSFWPWMYMEH